MEGFCVTILGGLCLEGLTHGGAYTWRGLFSEFYGIFTLGLHEAGESTLINFCF